MKPTWRIIFLLLTVLGVFLALIFGIKYILRIRIDKLGPQSQGNWYYVAVNHDKQDLMITDGNKLSILDKNPISVVESADNTKDIIYTKWLNDSISRIVLPHAPEAKDYYDNSSTQKQSIISSTDYLIRISQVADVKNSTVACSNVLSGGPKKEEFSDFSNLKTLTHRRGQGYSFEFTHNINAATKAEQTLPEPEVSYTFCIPDGDSRIWILDFFVSKKLDQKTYGKIIPTVVDSFAFVQ